MASSSDLGIEFGAEDFLDPLGLFHSPPEMPASPDYLALAEQTAESDLEAARTATEVNRPDIYSPLGSQTWEKPDTSWDAYIESLGKAPFGAEWSPSQEQYEDWSSQQNDWVKNINLSPEVKALFDKGLMMQDISADIGLQAGGQIQDTFSTPFELDDFEGYREDVYDAMLERLETDINKDWESRNAELYAGGIGRGTEAYGWEQMMRDRSLNDARLQAYQGATGQALKERGQTVQEALLERMQPLNEYNAWRTGAQVDLPSFQPGGQQKTTAGADYLGAGIEQGMWDLSGYGVDVEMFNQDKQDRMDIAKEVLNFWKPGGGM